MPGKDFRFGISSSAQGVDLNQLLISHALSTYFMRIASDMPALELHAGDIALVNKALKPKKSDIVVVSRADDPELKITCFKDATKELQLWGVVEHIIRKLRK